MPTPLVECIPNYSEARRPEVVETIVSSITAVPGLHVLDRHSDLDHNRTVITFVGSPQAVEDAAFLSISTAAKLIDLNIHSGEHPRIGATDVVPFVPISDITMQECVEMARRLGKRVAAELYIPVYLYEEAATRPERQNLENIRRGQYEGLKLEIVSNPQRIPDFGPCELGPAGATVIGARAPLIAFNVDLNTDDVSIAQKIAKAVRYSSGGLHFVKAMGVLVEGRAQVSMNLTNFRQTPIERVVEMVRREAEHYGVAIHHSELVGLIPQEALINSAAWYLQLKDFESGQILESRILEAVPVGKPAPGAASNFLDELASGSPTPGGGSAAALTGAAGAALVAMVARVSIGKKKYLDVESQMWDLIEKADYLRKELSAAVDEDAAAFEAFMNATHLPKDTPDHQTQRNAAMEKATLQTIQVPLRIGKMAVQVLDLAVTAAALGNIRAISDAAAGAQMARAALSAAGLNIRINFQGLQQPGTAQPCMVELESLENKTLELIERLRNVLKERADLILPI